MFGRLSQRSVPVITPRSAWRMTAAQQQSVRPKAFSLAAWRVRRRYDETIHFRTLRGVLVVGFQQFADISRVETEQVQDSVEPTSAYRCVGSLF